MDPVNITTLRQHLPNFIDRAAHGEIFLVTVRGKVMARLVPEQNESEAALARILSYRADCAVGDVLTPDITAWSTTDDHL